MRTRSTFLKLVATVALTYPHGTTIAQIRNGATVDAGPGVTVLHRAAEAGETATVKRLLEAGDPADVRNERAMTPLHRAAIAGQLGTAPSSSTEARRPECTRRR